MYQELATYGGWACAIVAGFVAAANFHALRLEKARSHNLYRRVQTCCDGLIKIGRRVTTSSETRPCERDMARFASETLAAQYVIANEGDA